jgi:predicted TIM-barrel fold metal-dependent hydrolase
MKVISGDSHVIEPPTLWVDYVDPEYRDRAPHIEQRDDTDVLVCEGLEFPPLSLYAGCLRGDDEVRTTGRWEEDIPRTAYDPALRRDAVVADGISGEVLFPTVGMAFYLLDDPKLRAGLFRGYNRWLADFCAAEPDFYRGLAALDVEDVHGAVDALEQARERGLRGAVVPLFAGTEERYSDPRFEPLWAAASALGMPVNIHRATSRDKNAVWTIGTLADRILRPPTEAQRVMLDLAFAGVFDRHPGMTLVSAENEAGWLGHMVEISDYWWTRNRAILNDPDLIRCVNPPSYYARNNMAATFMRDRTAVLSHPVNGADSFIFGTDFPHHVSTWPNSIPTITEQLEGVPSAVADQITWQNSARLYGFA